MPGAEQLVQELIGGDGAVANLPAPALVEEAVRRGEGLLARSGALCVTTGVFTGRSPRDKYVVDRLEVHDQVDWGPVNQRLSPEVFDSLFLRMAAYLSGRRRYVFEGRAGADPRYSLPVRVVTEHAWQSLFARNLLLREGGTARVSGDGQGQMPEGEEADPAPPGLLVLDAPGFRAVPELDGTRSETVIALDLVRRIVLIAGTAYAGEIKKGVFTFMNYWLPRMGVLSMHCSAVRSAGGRVALLFGLSGTGKTTLASGAGHALIGDDEHGWSGDGIFNVEGGCYAKCIRLSPEDEPQIWSAIRFGAVLENVDLDPATREVDFASARLTENTRAAYPVDFLPNARIPGVAEHPRTILFLTADASGVLPPIARLRPEQVSYYFLTGYTSRLAGTERGVTEPQAVFSPCFAAPFLPLPPEVYARMLAERVGEHRVGVFLVNTGWSGGPYGVGRRIPLAYTRRMVEAALEGGLDGVPYRREPVFHLDVPLVCPGVPPELLDPRRTWADPAAYDEAAHRLARRFEETFCRVAGQVAAGYQDDGG